MADGTPVKRPAMAIIGRLGRTGTLNDRNSVAEDVAHIEQQGMYSSAFTMRLAIIGGLKMRPRDWPNTSENAIMLGCANWGTALGLTSYCELVRRLGDQYVFLRKEHCCGAPLMLRAYSEGTDEDMREADRASSDFIGKNINAARELGANTMYHCCTWCAYLGVRFHGDSDVRQRYYLDHVVDLVERKQPRLKLNKRVAYFPGGQHRRVVYWPGIKWNFDWASYRNVLAKVEGLEIVDVPRFCCVTDPDAINNTVLKNGLDTLITPCLPCYGRMMRRAPKEIRVITVPELLLEALRDC